MPTAPKRYRPPGKKHHARSIAGRDRHRLYDTRTWRRASAAYLAENPWCVECEAEGVPRGATATDHKIPHGGDERAFWDQANWQGLCTTHHARKSAKERHEATI